MKRLAVAFFVVLTCMLGSSLAQLGQLEMPTNAKSVSTVPPGGPARQEVPKKQLTNKLGMVFAWIPPGSFSMGSPENEEGRFESEMQHKVKLTKGIYMGVFPVTQEQWQKIMGNNPSHFVGQRNLPVESVSWTDCQVFIEKLREKDKRDYRLPTEAEWEYACRAGTATPFYFGDTISTNQANYDGEVAYGSGLKGIYRNKTTPVGSFPANAFGLCDMHGNVDQWCEDWHGDYPHKDVIDPQGQAQGKARIVRGGSWHFWPHSCRSASRGRIEPNRGDSCIGFRLCFSEK